MNTDQADTSKDNEGKNRRDSEEPQQSVNKRIIKPVDIRTEERKGNTVIVVEDSHGQEFTRLQRTGENDVEQKIGYWSMDYVGKPTEVKYTVSKGRFLNLYGLGPVKPGEEIDPEIRLPENEGKSARINRQNAQQHASRIVAAKLEGEKIRTGSRVTDEEILSELEKWESVFRHHAETGEWQLPGDQQ